MSPSIASPLPLRFQYPRANPNDYPANDAGRETPLPQYEKSQSASLPFTLNLQEDSNHPGQFQLVINVGTTEAATLALTASGNDVTSTDTNTKPSSALGSVLYQTQKASPPTSPLDDQKDWTDIENVTPDFFHKVVPDWALEFARSDSTVSRHSRKLSDIKARIKRTGKGYVVRLLKGSSVGSLQIAEVDLNGTQAIVEESSMQELDSLPLRAELSSVQPSGGFAVDTSIGRPDVFEIGTSNELGTVPSRTSTVSAASAPASPPFRVPSFSHASFRSSITEGGLSDAETLVPDVRSLENWPDNDPMDRDPARVQQPMILPRSNSVSSIVKTPTRGLSVVGPVRRVEKSHRYRNSNKANRLDRPRSDSQKGPGYHAANRQDSSNSRSRSPDMVSLDRTALRKCSRSTIHQDFFQASTPFHKRRLSANDSTTPSHKSKLSLQTNMPVYRSKRSSPLERRKQSSRAASPQPSSASCNDAANGAYPPYVSPQTPKADLSKELREAVVRALGLERSPEGPKRTICEPELPVIQEPSDDEAKGSISLPHEFELRSTPIDSRGQKLRFWNLAISALSDKAYGALKMLRDRYGTEPLVPHGHVRVRWTCSCGESLYDDYIERRPNAARLFEAYLNRPRTHGARSPTSQDSSVSSMASIFDTSSRASTLATPSSTYAGSSSWGKQSNRSKYSPIRTRPNSPFSVQMPSQVEESWLLTCANEGRLTPKVVHIDVNESRVKSDKDLALALRQHYDQLNSHWYSWARLRGLTTIEFVQFEIHRNRFADIRATPSMPPKTATSASTTPGAEKSQSPSQYPYKFEPNDLLPPVGSTYLLHLFQHPADYDGELITYLRSPKRRTRLEFGMGWGVHLVEGFLAQRIWAVTVGVFGLGSAVFAILWAVRKHDVQGAFGVAQWVLGIAVLLVGALQAWIE